jgi:hypothetical protein
MFRVIQESEGIDDADTLDGGREIVHGQQPNPDVVDEIQADPFPPTARRGNGDS